MSEQLRRLPGPYELLELSDRQSIDLKVVSWERGTMEIHPRYAGAPATKEIPVLRVHVPADIKALPPQYYDVTSKTLAAQWLPFLLQRGFEKWTFRITAYGVAPRKRFSLERLPF